MGKSRAVPGKRRTARPAPARAAGSAGARTARTRSCPNQARPARPAAKPAPRARSAGIRTRTPSPPAHRATGGMPVCGERVREHMRQATRCEEVREQEIQPERGRG